MRATVESPMRYTFERWGELDDCLASQIPDGGAAGRPDRARSSVESRALTRDLLCSTEASAGCQ
jgi:hypothetical protein